MAALGESVHQKAGLLNIGLEGQMIVAAFVGLMTTQLTKSPDLGMVAGISSAMILGLLQAWLTIWLGADQVVVGTAINLFGLGVTGTLYRIRFGQSGELLSVPHVARGIWGLDIYVVFWIFASGALAWILFRLNWGLIIRALGEFPNAVRAAGFSPRGLRIQATMVGGFFAGLGGAYLSLGLTGSFTENMTDGRGFIALAMVTFGRWNPIWVMGASLLVGYLDSLQFELQARSIGFPPQIFIALPYVIALIVLIFASKGSVAPDTLGQQLSAKGES